MTERIVITSAPPGGLSANFEWRFGRCAGFTLVGLNDGKIESVSVTKNDAASAMGGAGIQAAQIVGNLNPNVVIVGNLGPNAAGALQNVNAKLLQYNGAGGMATVKDVLDAYIQGKLSQISSANVASHFGMGGGMGRGGGQGMGRGQGRGFR